MIQVLIKEMKKVQDDQQYFGSVALCLEVTMTFILNGKAIDNYIHNRYIVNVVDSEFDNTEFIERGWDNLMNGFGTYFVKILKVIENENFLVLHLRDDDEQIREIAKLLTPLFSGRNKDDNNQGGCINETY